MKNNMQHLRLEECNIYAEIDTNSIPMEVLNDEDLIDLLVEFLPVKSGKEILNEALEKWNFDYEEKRSLTNSKSMTIKISNLVFLFKAFSFVTFSIKSNSISPPIFNFSHILII